MIWFFLTLAILLIVFGWIIFKNSKDDIDGRNVAEAMLLCGIGTIGLIILSVIK